MRIHHIHVTLAAMSLVIVALLFMSYYENTKDQRPVVLTYEQFQRIW